jgi:hypothetical protein
MIEGYTEMYQRAERISLLIRERAKREFDKAFGQKSQSFECFHLARNWISLPTLTPEQRRVCRLMRHLEHLSWKPHRIVDEWYRRRALQQLGEMFPRY